MVEISVAVVDPTTVHGLVQRLTGLFDGMEIRKSAQELRALWVLGNEYLTAAAPWTAIKRDPERAALIVRTGINLVGLFARVAAPIIPFTAETTALAVGEAYPGAWPSVDGAAELSRIEAGRKVRAPEVLFRKIEDAQIAEWSARFGGDPSAAPVKP